MVRDYLGRHRALQCYYVYICIPLDTVNGLSHIGVIKYSIIPTTIESIHINNISTGNQPESV